MGCDIHSFAERRNKQTNKWEKVGENPFDWRSYSMFAFLAGVRNYDHCEPLSEPKGLPNDISDEVKEEYGDGDGWYYHSASFLTAKELLDFDYDKTFWNRRVTKQTSSNSWNGASLAEEREGKVLTYRENLGESFFTHLNELKELGEPEDIRIVFWFDN